MKNQILESCSRLQAERYLLNKLSPEDETLFQMHLEGCETCREYVNSLRKLSWLVADEELISTKVPVKKRSDRRQKMWLWSIVSLAACSIFIAGLSFYLHNMKDNGYGISTNETYINERTKATKAEVTAELLFPDKEILTLHTGTPVVFKWNKETNYRLVVKCGNQAIVETKGFGSSYTMPAEKMDGCPVLNWTLIIDNKTFIGQIQIK